VATAAGEAEHMQDKPGSIVSLMRLLAEIDEDDLKRAEPERLLDLIAACIDLSVVAAEELNRLPEERRLNLLPEASWPRLPVRSALRVIEGGKGRGAPMWKRLYELHAREEAGSITPAEAQEVQRIELHIGRRPGEETGVHSPLREAIYLRDPFGRLCD